MLRDEQVFFEDIARACEEILDYVDRQDLGSYLADGRTRRAVERCLEMIGESFVKLRRGNEGVLADIPDYQKIIGLRNLLIDEYGRVDDIQMWQAASSKLPAFLSAIQRS